MILGAGGAARAIGFALREAGIGISIAARRLDQAQALADILDASGGQEAAATVLTFDALSRVLPAIDLVVNCTPVGMMPAADASPLSESALSRLPAGAVVHDLVYRPLETRLLAMARARGLRGVDGGVMLVAQAAEAFEAWTGLEAPQALMMGVFAEATGEVS